MVREGPSRCLKDLNRVQKRRFVVLGPMQAFYEEFPQGDGMGVSHGVNTHQLFSCTLYRSVR